MLAFRFALVGTLAAIALWGLFSLLDALKEPELLRSPRAIILKGCDPMESEEARKLCPSLRCQKTLLDSKTVPLNARFQIDTQRAAADSQLIAGTARAEGSEVLSFACITQASGAVSARLLGPDELDALLSQDGGWTFEPAR